MVRKRLLTRLDVCSTGEITLMKLLCGLYIFLIEGICRGMDYLLYRLPLNVYLFSFRDVSCVHLETCLLHTIIR